MSSVGLGAVPDEQLLELLTARARQLGHDQAQVWAVMAEIAHRDPMPHAPIPLTAEQVFESAVDEVRAELRLTRRAARRELEAADAVVGLPRVFEALQAGQLDRARALVLAESCVDLTPEQTERLLDELLPSASTVTATELAQRVRRVAIALDPCWAERRYREAVRERRVIGYLNEDGSATVAGQYLPVEQAAAACGRVDALADAAKRTGASAPIDHLRAELFLGLLDGRFHGMPESAIVAALLELYPPAREEVGPVAPTAADSRPVLRGLQLTVGLGTLLEHDEQPGELAGWGSVPASVARAVAAQQHRAQWRFAILDDAGRLLFDGLTRRRPGQAAAAGESRGGIVELHVPARLLRDETLPARHPEYAGMLADLAAQFAVRRQIDQDPTARFAGRPLRRRMQILFQRCIFPGCRRPATSCDQDHRRDHSRGGRTDEENLAPGCRHDHMNKTLRGWRLLRTGPRSFVWISPLGRRHTVDLPLVAAPLPAPIPRVPSPRRWYCHAGGEETGPTFQRLTQRGLPLDVGIATEAGPSRSVAWESDPDPPPF